MNPRDRVERLVIGSTPAQLAEARRLLGSGEPGLAPTPRLAPSPIKTCGRCAASYSRGGATVSLSYGPPASTHVSGIDACGACADGILRSFGVRR